ncbi:MAG: hypothetical protein AAGA54_31830, partial [Myxococcota bacterium]
MLALVLGMRLSAPSIPPPPPEDPFPAAFELIWDAPSGCSSAEAIEARVAALLDGAPRGQGTAQVHAAVTEAPTGVTMTLTTTYAGRSDARTVTSPSCGSLEEATALLLAIALEPRLAPAETPKPAPEPEPEPEPEPPQQPARVEPPARATPRSPSPPTLPPAVTPEPRVAAASPGRRERRLKPSVAAAVGGEWGQIRLPTVAV